MSFPVSANMPILVINSVTLSAAWVRPLNIEELLGSPNYVGENPELDGVAGVIAEAPIAEAKEVTLQFVIAGDVLHSGSAPSSSQIGVMTNVDYIKTNVVTGAASVTATVDRPGSLSTLTGSVQVRGFRVSEARKGARAELDLILLSGALA